MVPCKVGIACGEIGVVVLKLFCCNDILAPLASLFVTLLQWFDVDSNIALWCKVKV